MNLQPNPDNSSKVVPIMETAALLLLGLRITTSFQSAVPTTPIYLYYGYLTTKLLASLLMVLALLLALLELVEPNQKLLKFAAAALGVGVISAACNTFIAFLFALK